MQRVDVLAGAQGAGMVNALYLRPGAAAVVLFQFGAASDMFRDVLEVGSALVLEVPIHLCGSTARGARCCVHCTLALAPHHQPSHAKHARARCSCTHCLRLLFMLLTFPSL